MKSRSFSLPGAVALGVGMAAIMPGFISTSMAQGLGQRGPTETITVVAEQQGGSLTAVTEAQARAALEQVPGGIGFVTAEDFLDGFAQSIGDTLVFTPGVFADTSATRENRISIRGSGLSATFERRGLTLLRDGVPITRASGSTEFQEVDPLSTDYIEVYKGANGLRYGAASLGGAVNIVTPTGRTMDNTAQVRLSGGSFDTARLNVQGGYAGDKWDAYLSVTGLYSKGFREHSKVQSAYGFGNVGYRVSDTVETRFYLTLISDNFDLTAGLPLDVALNDPKNPGLPVVVGPFFPGGPVRVIDPGPVADDWERDLNVIRLSNKTVINMDNADLEFGGWYSYRTLFHPITRFAGIIDQRENEVGLFARVSGEGLVGTMGLSWIFGVTANYGQNDAKTFVNNGGSKGALRTDGNQNSANVIVYGEASLSVVDDFAVIVGGQFIYSDRDFKSIVGPRPDDNASYNQFSPKFGVLWRWDDTKQVYANVSRSFEPPAFADLTAGGAAIFSALEAQRAWTVEIGTRGQMDWVSWDLSLYRSHIRNELIDSFNGFITLTENADKTVHQGIELGVDFYINPRALTEAGLSLVWRHVYTFNDFFFDNDPVLGDNRLPGVPKHIYITEVRLNGGLQGENGWYIGVDMRWIPDGAWTDYSNTTRAPGYAIFGVKAGYSLNDRIELFFSAENITDKRYISNIATEFLTDADSRIFTPGQGRAFFGGITVKL